MKFKSTCLALLLSFTTAIAYPPLAVQAEDEYSAPRSRRGQDVSQQNASDDILRARRDRMRGMGVDTRRPELPQGMLGVNVKTLRGVQVLSVLPGSPAAKAGILTGDIILEVNKTAINTAEELQQTVAKNSAGEPLLIGLNRKGRPFTVSAIIGASAKDNGIAAKPAVAEDIDPAQTSDDPTFGYTKENPVKVGGATLREGVAASYVYLKQLRDKNRKPLKYSRVGNVGAGHDGHITDLYKLTDSEGAEFSIYIDAYHPEKNVLDCKAPKGMFIVQ